MDKQRKKCGNLVLILGILYIFNVVNIYKIIINYMILPFLLQVFLFRNYLFAALCKVCFFYYDLRIYLYGDGEIFFLYLQTIMYIIIYCT